MNPNYPAIRLGAKVLRMILGYVKLGELSNKNGGNLR